jgi:hypothetical protein
MWLLRQSSHWPGSQRRSIQLQDKGAYTDEENLRELVRLVNQEMDSVAGNYRDELHVIANEIVGINNRLERLYDALETGGLGLDDVAPRIRQLRYRMLREVTTE